MRGFRAGLAAVAVAVGVQSAAADIFPRISAAAGSVIARKSGEEVSFIDVGGWRGVDVHQDLLVGDTLRTNALGHLAILFSDNTQLRLGRNTTMVVKKLASAEDTVLGLQEGTVWGRAERGGSSVTLETPAAAAAIRGTDWSLTVEGDRTSLIVLEGVVELSNAQGSVSVSRGEAASARIGEKPTKTVIVDPDDREQMLFYLSLRGAFTWMPVSPLSSPDMRAARDRITAKPEPARTSEDWLTLAEVSLSYEGREAAAQAADQARGFRLTAAQKARLTLIDALNAGADADYIAADRMFRQAAGGLDARRRAIALYGGYFSRALAHPDRAEAPPKVAGGGPYAAMAEAWTAGFLKDVPAAIAVLKRAETRYPDDPTLPAYRAQLAMLLDDRKQVQEAYARSLAIDPDDPTALEARANYVADIEGNIEAAHADLTRAAGIAPGSSSIWNALGLVEIARGATREAEAALNRAIALDERDPVGHANLAILYLDQNRVAEARAEIDKALEYDPAFDIGLVARGRYHLQAGELDQATQDLLAGTTANPAYAQGLLLLGAAYYAQGDRDGAGQAFDNAERLDPNDPVAASIRTSIAINDYDADGAITAAQEALKRTRARGGDYAALSANKDAGSTLNDAFRLQGLEAWGRYYGDAVFDPFTASGYVDQAVVGSANPFANQADYGAVQAEPVQNDASFSAFFQGLMLDPLMLAGSERKANIVRTPFVEAALGGGFTNSHGRWGWTSEAELRGYSATPAPWSVYGQLQWRDTASERQVNNPPLPVLSGAALDTDTELVAGNAYVTANPTPNDRVVTYVDVRRQNQALSAVLGPGVLPPGALVEADDGTDTRLANLGTAWSHTFGYRNVASLAFFASDVAQDRSRLRTQPQLDPVLGLVNVSAFDRDNLDQRSYILAAAHAYGIGDVTLRYGAEAGLLENSEARSTTLSFPDFPNIPPIPVIDASTRDRAFYGRAFVDARYEVSPSLALEGGLFGTVIDGDALNSRQFEPRLGVAWSPAEGQWLRAGYLRETRAVGVATLAPVGVLGLQANQAPLDAGGTADTAIARWDAEWSSRLFTSVEYQHQDMKDLSIGQPAQFDTIDLARGRIDRVSATGNLWIGGGFGAFATVAYADSRNRDPASAGYGNALPYVPDLTARLGLTYVDRHDVKVTLAGTYVGPRLGSVTGDRLDGFWTADAFLQWEPFDKRFSVEMSAYNLLDTKFDMSPGTPGWGRTVVGSVKVRF